MPNTKYVEEAFEYLHRNPEIGLQEFRTSEYISGELKKHGYHVVDGVAGTGIIAALGSGVPGPVLGLRADMDALPFVIDGKRVNIHACGHDANSAMVLATARHFGKTGISRGKLVTIFQPAEESLEGASLMLKDGEFKDLEELVGIHLRPVEEAALGEASPAVYHGACHRIRVGFRGTPSHSARPHLGINTIEAAALAIHAVHAVRVDPMVPHSVKATRINSAGPAHNIIPDRTEVVFDLRAQQNGLMEILLDKVTTAIRQSAKSVGAETDIAYVSSVPAAEYDDRMLETARSAIEGVFGQVIGPIINPGSEDFHVFTKTLHLKSAYIGLGADLGPGLHRPDMAFDLKALEYGQEILKNIVLKRLA